MAKYKAMVLGIIFASMFAAVFYAAAGTLSYAPIKLPAAVSSFVAHKTLAITTSDNIPVDSSVVQDIAINSQAVSEVIAKNPIISSDKLVELDEKILEAGIPIDGVALIDKNTRQTRIDFKKDATPEQRLQAQQIKDSFDWTITYKDIFDPEKAKQEILDFYSVEKLVALASYLPIVDHFLDQKDFTKLKSFIENLYSQHIITQDDYTILNTILIEQKIYLNPNFGTAAQAPPVQTPVQTPPVEVTPPSTEVTPPASEIPPIENPPVLPPPDINQEASPSSLEAPLFPNTGMVTTVVSSGMQKLFDMFAILIQPTKNAYTIIFNKLIALFPF